MHHPSCVGTSGDADRLRSLLVGLPLPPFPDHRLVPAMSVSPWLRSDASCTPSLRHQTGEPCPDAKLKEIQQESPVCWHLRPV
ncbi:hypothetical protein CTU88_35315 [Streptomyces sp. JV178]|nr:hypothetical protein CTU88_35315 [Streptomyces sp. JV178]